MECGVDNIERISRALGILPRDLLDRDLSADRFYKKRNTYLVLMFLSA
jgi:hypothetical protein